MTAQHWIAMRPKNLYWVFFITLPKIDCHVKANHIHSVYPAIGAKYFPMLYNFCIHSYILRIYFYSQLEFLLTTFELLQFDAFFSGFFFTYNSLHTFWHAISFPADSRVCNSFDLPFINVVWQIQFDCLNAKHWGRRWEMHLLYSTL